MTFRPQSHLSSRTILGCLAFALALFVVGCGEDQAAVNAECQDICSTQSCLDNCSDLSESDFQKASSACVKAASCGR